MTNAHTRHKDYRNLYRATPAAVKHQSNFEWEQETKEMVAKGYAAFWKRRGLKAPWVSSHVYGLLEEKEEA